MDWIVAEFKKDSGIDLTKAAGRDPAHQGRSGEGEKSRFPARRNTKSICPSSRADAERAETHSEEIDALEA